MIRSTSGYRVGMWGRLRMGRKFAYSSNFFRSATLMLGNPPPTGVVTGPFNDTRVRSMDSINSLGMYSPDFLNASAPTANVSHSNFSPVASRMRTVALVTSGPIPSPGISVTLWVIISLDLCSLGLNLYCFLRLDQILQLIHKLFHVLEIQI